MTSSHEAPCVHPISRTSGAHGDACRPIVIQSLRTFAGDVHVRDEYIVIDRVGPASEGL